MVTLHVQAMPDRVTVSGYLANRAWRMDLDVATREDRPGVSVLWVRRKIAALMDQQHLGVAAHVVRSDVLAVARRHHLVSKFMSLVAVDVTPVRPGHADLTAHALTANLPNGQAIGLPKTATWAPLHLRLGMLLFALSIVMVLARRRVSDT